MIWTASGDEKVRHPSRPRQMKLRELVIRRLFTLMGNPYSDQPGMEAYAAPPPNWGKHVAVSCSS